MSEEISNPDPSCPNCDDSSFEKEFSTFTKEFFSTGPRYAAERQLLLQAMFTTALLLGLEMLLYMAFFHNLPGVPASKALYLGYLVLSVVGNAAILWHLQLYPRVASHMEGMMIGMTAGMMTGLMLGAVIGAVNGIFIGSLVGLLAGCAVGAYAGRCCGMMGVMEGLMAGIMGGTMGPMISQMMALDHLELFFPLFMLADLAVLFGLTYMVVHSPYGKQAGRPRMDFGSFAALCASAVLVLTALLFWGPHSAAVAVG